MTRRRVYVITVTSDRSAKFVGQMIEKGINEEFDSRNRNDHETVTVEPWNDRDKWKNI